MFNRKISYLLDRIRLVISLPAFITLLLLFIFCCGIKYYYAPNYLEYRPVDSIHEVKVVADESMQKFLEQLPSDTVFERQDNSYTPFKPGAERRQLRILVTGGTGFVGSHLVDKLMKEGHEVIVLDNFIAGRKQNVEQWNGNPNFELIEHDVIDRYYVEVDQIYHLASPALSSHYMHDPTMNMLSLARLVKARILLISTSEEYEDPKIEIRNEMLEFAIHLVQECISMGKKKLLAILFYKLYEINQLQNVYYFFVTLWKKMMNQKRLEIIGI